MGAQGSTTINFGAAPGGYEASVSVTGQTGIAASSLVEAWITPVATADHSADEHLVDPPRVIAGAIVAGTGFTIYGYAPDLGALSPPFRFASSVQDRVPRVYGQWTVAWVWN